MVDIGGRAALGLECGPSIQVCLPLLLPRQPFVNRIWLTVAVALPARR